jgi:protein-ribulosamine 3-kinase
VSEPVEDWDARNLLYSLTFNIGNTIYIPGSQQRQVVFDDMTTLCKLFCPDDLKVEMAKLSAPEATAQDPPTSGGGLSPGEDEDEEEEEEEELPL